MKRSRTRQLTVLLASAFLTSQLVPVAMAAGNEPEPISNQSLPVAPSATTSLAKRVWSTLDVRKLKNAQVPGKKKTIAQALPKTESKTEENPVEKKLVATTQSVKKEEPSSASLPRIDAQEKKAESKPETSEWTWNAGGENTDTAATAASATTSPASAVTTEVTTPVASAATTQTETPAAVATPAPESQPAVAPPPETKTETAAPQTEKAASGTESGPFSVAQNLTSLPAGSVISEISSGQAPLVVDSDEDEEVEETLAYEEMPTDEGKTKAKAGARFPIVISSQISSKTAKENDPIQGRLKYDLKIGDRLIASKGSVVNGHLNYVLKARTILHSLVSKERWYRNSGALGLAFDEIVNEKNDHIPLKAQPARQSRIVKNKAEGRELGVNHYGQVTGPWGPQLRHKAIRIGLNFAMAPAGAFTFGAMPLALGCIGAANPSFAFSKPVGLNVRHRRLKGFAWGFLSGVPGSWLIEDTTVKGQEAVIKPGDEFYAELVEEFTGEAATDAQLMPGASAKVKGEVLTKAKKQKPSKK